MTLVQTLFSFHGRIRRRDWWAWTIGLLLIETLLVRLVVLAIDGPSLALQQGNVFTWLMGDDERGSFYIIASICMLALTWSHLALSTKRAKDRGKSILFVQAILLASTALSLFPPGVIGQWGAALDAGDWINGMGAVVTMIVGVLSLASFVMLGFLDGTPGHNPYGPSPKSTENESVAQVFD